MLEGFRGDVDELDLFGLFDEAVGDGFLDKDASNLGDDVAEAFDVLDVDGRPDIDPGIENVLDFLPSFCMAQAGGVGVGEFVDEADIGAGLDDGFGV